VEVAPFPRSQNHFMGLPVDRSRKLTIKGAQPEVTSAVKLAVCAWEKITPERNKRVSAVFVLNIVDLGLMAVFERWLVKHKRSAKTIPSFRNG